MVMTTVQVMEQDYKGETMKQLILILTIFLIGEVFAQPTSPSGYTTNYRFRLWTQGANPSADSLNANWTLADTKIKLAYDSAQVKVNTYGNQTIGGTKTISGTLSLGAAGKLTLGTAAPSANGQLGYSSSILRYYHSSGTTDTVASRGWVRTNFNQNGIRLLWADGVGETTVNTHATENEYSVNVTTSTTEATYYVIKIPFYKQADEDSLIMHYQAYYNLDLGTAVLQRARTRFYINSTFYGEVETSNDGGAGYRDEVLRADISALAEGFYTIWIALSIDLDTGSSGASTHYLRRPYIYTKY